ncbi:hypothetical protein [Paenibacillus mucilaginosus]|uniref:hypothetical protein n=1 Tax=Paenibacillus mucilaginosus TaxID=61624 RepID=UPI003D19E18F
MADAIEKPVRESIGEIQGFVEKGDPWCEANPNPRPGQPSSGTEHKVSYYFADRINPPGSFTLKWSVCVADSRNGPVNLTLQQLEQYQNVKDIKARTERERENRINERSQGLDKLLKPTRDAIRTWKEISESLQSKIS